MAKTPSKKSDQVVKKSKTKKTSEKNEQAAKTNYRHRSFRRSYKEDYQKPLHLPSIMQQVLGSFRIIFKNFRLFLPLVLIAVVLNVLFVGVMSGADYTKLAESVDESTAPVGKAGVILAAMISNMGLSSGSAGATIVFQSLVFVFVFLTTIFILRYLLAKKEIKLRDAMYNSMAPLVPTAVIMIMVAIECIPLLILLIAYTAAVQTEFLNYPFYALLFLGFAALMVLISGYLLSSSLIAFVAVSAPGIYPMTALNLAAELMRGKRINFVLRLVALIIVVVLMWIIVMIPLIMLDVAAKNGGVLSDVPFIPICIMIMGGFTDVLVTTYLYLYYRWLLDN